MGTTSSAIFTGSSQFSQDFANSITRSVNLASQPITQMQSDVTALQSQSDALSNTSGIGSKFTALQNAVQAISQAMSGSSFQTDISNPSAVSATVADGAMEGTYSIDVQNIGTYATSLSASAWVNQPNPSGQKHTYQLVIDTGSGPSTINITPSDNSAASVAQAINLAAGDKVQATVVNVGPNDSRISLKSNTLGPATLDIQDGGTSLQQQGPAGELASYSVDGNPAVSSTSRTITLAPGLSVNLLSGDSGVPVNITVSRSTSALSSALSGFADAYNAAVDSLDAQRGQTQGSLGGQSIVSQLSQTLSSLATYTVPGSNISGLSALGFDLGVDGHLTYNQFSMMSTDISNSAGVTAFLGSATDGGFLKAATDAMTSVEDPTTGLIQTTETGIQNQIDDLNSRISDKQDQVNQLQQNLQAQMAAADAAIATMEQQYSYMSSVFQAQQTADQMYK